MLLALIAAPRSSVGSDPPRPAAFNVDYVVRISRRHPGRADVRWLLAGIDEIVSFRLELRDDRITEISGSGRLVREGSTVRWTPGGPYAHLRYRVAVPRARPPAGRYESFATPDWVATRALHLFPEINVTFRSGARGSRGRGRLLLRLPRGWESVTALRSLGEDSWAVDEPNARFPRPRGWMLLGGFARQRREIAGSEVTVATAPGSRLDVLRLLKLYQRTMPRLQALLGPPPPRLLVVSAPDPMWRGGLSGEDSFFVNGQIPLRSSDETSTYLHELFHVWQPFRPAPDGRWITEGLAEYYSLALQRDAGRLSPDRFSRGIDLLARYGRWDVDLARTRAPAALNNSAPFVLFHLDDEIRRATADRQSLDDVVRAVAASGGSVSTAAFLQTASRIAGRDLTPFFQRHVFRGIRPENTAIRH
jgi:predicted metalloprotease with PDZ domain